MVSVKAVGIPVRNESLALVCTGTEPPNVTGLSTVSVQWQLGGAELTNSTLEGVSVTKSGSIAILNFSFLDNDTHERHYVCMATLSITNVPMTRNSSTTYTLMTLSKFNYMTCSNSKTCSLVIIAIKQVLFYQCR